MSGRRFSTAGLKIAMRRGVRREFPRELGRNRWVAGLILANLLLSAWLGWLGGLEPMPWPDRVSGGEAIVHGLAYERISWSMPLAGVLESIEQVHLPSTLRPVFTNLAMAASLLLVFSLGSLLDSGACGLMAAGLVVLLDLLNFVDAQEHVFYVLSVLLVANLLAWRVRSPDPGRGAGLGLGVGISLLIRSPLFLFPALLTIYEKLAARGEPVRGLFKRHGPIWGVPALILLPWIYMNWAVHGRLTLFEHGRATPNIILGSLGLLPGVIGTNLTGVAGIEEGSSVIMWALGEILRHPLRYAGGYLARLWYVLTLQPLLLGGALISLWVLRARRGFRQIGLLAGYFIVVHCLLAVVPRYFAPVWPLLAVLAAGLPASRLGASDDKASPRAAVGVMGACLLSLAALSAVAEYGLLLYPSRVSERERTAAGLLTERPNDPWLLARSGRRYLRQGKIDSSVRAFAQAYRADPRPHRALDYAEALIVRGGRGADLLERGRFSGGWRPLREYSLRALGRLRRGDGEQAARALEAARAAIEDCRLTRVRTEAERLFQKRLCTGESRLSAELLRVLDAWPFRPRAQVLRRLARAPWVSAAVLIEAADLAAGAGSRAESLELLGRAAAAGPGAARQAEIAELYVRLKEPERAAELIRALSARRAPGGLRSQIALARAAGRAGARAVALEALGRAEALRPDARQAVEIARVYAQLGEQRRALAVLEPLLERAPGDAGLLIAAASVAAELGERGRAAEVLRRALARSPSPSQRLGAARLYQQWKRCDAAMKILGPLTREPATAAAAFQDRGICFFLRGDTRRAAADLEESLRRDSRRLAAYLSLGTVYSARGRESRALETYERALAVSAGKSERPVRRLIVKERDRLLSSRSK